MLSDDVLFLLVLAGQIEGDKTADTSLAMIIKMWITIRGFSFAKNSMEMYKQETKKELKKPNHYASLYLLDYNNVHT